MNITDNDERAAKLYLIFADYESKVLIDKLYVYLGEFGLQESNLLAAHRLMTVYGFSARAVLRMISSYTGIFN